MMPPKPESLAPGAVLRTLLISDLVESTRLVEELGDTSAAELLRRHDRLARDLLAEHEGLEIDKTDGFLMLFERPVEAVLYALDYHQILRRISRDQGRELEARVAIHLGEVVLFENPLEDVERGAKPLEVEGLAKPTAARLMSLARGGQTLLTRGAFDLARRGMVGVRGATELRWLAHGAYRLSGVVEPAEVFEVGREGLAPLIPPADSEKARRVDEQPRITGWQPAPGVSIPHRSHWRVKEKIGEGGFGEVWLARHRKTRERRVFKFCYDLARLRSLQREITLFRLLKEELGEREDITRILDWNFDQAPYFIESEYTAAGSLPQWLEAQSAEQVSLEARLEIIAQVATALAAAHTIGVLHKDVKGSNVLIQVGPDGEVKAQLADFGVGHVMEKERLDEAGITVLGLTERTETSTGSSISGTRLYMAPELLEGKPATIQADIYALGVLLYQLVVGDFSRSMAPGWRRDLDDDLLVEDLACFLDRSPTRRPASAREVAERLRSLKTRRAEREAAEAARRALEQSQRRRKLAVAIATIIVVAVGVVSGFAAWARKARRAEEKARRASEFLVELVAATDPFGDSEPGAARDKPAAAKDCCETVVKTLEQVRSEFEMLEAGPDLQSELLSTLGHVLRKLGRRDAAWEALEESVEVWRQHYPEDLSGQSARINNLGVMYLEEGDYDIAEKLFREVLALRDQLDGEDGVTVTNLNNLATVLMYRGRYGEAEQLYRRGLEIRRRSPEGSDESKRVSASLRSLGAALLLRGDFVAAEPPLREALEIGRRLYGDEDTRVVSVLDLLGRVRFALGDAWEAEQLFRRAAEIRRRLLGEDHAAVPWSDHNLGVLLLAEGEVATARVVIEQVHAGLRRALPADHWRIAAADALLGALLTAEGRFEEAENCLIGGHERLRAVRGEHSSYTRDARRWIGELYEASGRPEEAASFEAPPDPPAAASP